MTKTAAKKGKGKFTASSIIEGITQQAPQSQNAQVENMTPSKSKSEIRKQLVLTRELDEKVKKYILKESFERGQRLSFNGLVVELLQNLTKD